MHFRNTLAVIASILLVFTTLTSAFAESQTFNKPRLGGNRLDWCNTWANGCGEPAASAFCQQKGYTKATDFLKAAKVSEPTQTIGEGAICNSGGCDSFRSITCERVVNSKDFSKPKFGDMRLDWCLNWGSDCGEPAADAFCEQKGFVKANQWTMAEDVGPTRLLGTTAVCQSNDCDGFAKIRCTNN